MRHCATSRKVADLIPGGVIGFFHGRNPCGCTVALGLIQPLSEMSTRSSSFGGGSKGGQCIDLTNLPLSYADCLEIREPQPSGTLRACTGITLSLLYKSEYCSLFSAL
jgi:hypothetical protein